MQPLKQLKFMSFNDKNKQKLTDKAPDKLISFTILMKFHNCKIIREFHYHKTQSQSRNNNHISKQKKNSGVILKKLSKKIKKTKTKISNVNVIFYRVKSLKKIDRYNF